MMSRPANRIYEFGSFRLDPAEHVCLRGSEPVSLRPKEFALLVALVQNHGHVLTKDELLKGVWADQFVEEGNLNRHISSLRKALGETPGELQFVETVPKVGYRFVAPVKEIGDRSGDMVIERHTIARIVSEEEEEADEHLVLKPALTAKALLKGHEGRSKPKRQLAFAGLGVLLVIFMLALTKPWDSRKSPVPAATPAVKSLAVLPFKSIGEVQEDEYLGLGMADALITKLATSES